MYGKCQFSRNKTACIALAKRSSIEDKILSLLAVTRLGQPACSGRVVVRLDVRPVRRGPPRAVPPAPDGVRGRRLRHKVLSLLHLLHEVLSHRPHRRLPLVPRRRALHRQGHSRHGRHARPRRLEYQMGPDSDFSFTEADGFGAGIECFMNGRC